MQREGDNTCIYNIHAICICIELIWIYTYVNMYMAYTCMRMSTLLFSLSRATSRFPPHPLPRRRPRAPQRRRSHFDGWWHLGMVRPPISCRFPLKGSFKGEIGPRKGSIKQYFGRTLSFGPSMKASNICGLLFGSPCNKDQNMLGSRLRPPDFWKFQYPRVVLCALVVGPLHFGFRVCSTVLGSRSGCHTRVQYQGPTRKLLEPNTPLLRALWPLIADQRVVGWSWYIHLF